MIVTGLSSIYLLSAGGIAIFGMLGLTTLWFYWRHHRDHIPDPTVPHWELPLVTVQLPIYNERYVVGRLIKAAANLDYPKALLDFQVIDDSADDTTAIASDLVQKYADRGLDIKLIHRSNRVGYKAGALQAAMPLVKGEFIAIFDADFQPPSDFLMRTIPHFVNEPQLGVVQTRWGHLNAGQSTLTRAQSIALDRHFTMEQTVRDRACLFPRFSGSAGIWRRTCLEESGGWEADTVTEDLCLSTRAVLGGWKFRFLNNVVAPAELPTTVTAYKSQHARWALGTTQCLVKFGRAILADKNHSLIARTYAFLSMASYFNHLLFLILLLVQVPLIYFDYRPPVIMALFGTLGIGQTILFTQSQRALYPDWWRRLRYLPALLIMAVGLAPTGSRAIFQAVTSRNQPFVRTPKGGQLSIRKGRPPGQTSIDYRLPIDWITFVELFLAAYALLGLILSIRNGNYGPTVFMSTSALGFSVMAIASLKDRFN